MADSLKSSDVPSVHGLVVVNPDGSAVGAPVGGATATNQTDGSQKTQIVDAGGEVATVTGGKLDVNATASLAGDSIPATGATTAVSVQILDGSGNQITSFGGGTQYQTGVVAGSTDTGTVGLLVRDDVLATLSDPDGDYTQGRANSKGAMWTAVDGSVVVQDGGGSLTVDNNGTFATQAAQSGTWTVQPGNTANTTAWKVDGSAVTQPVSGIITANLGTLNGAALAANQQTDALTDAQLRAVAVPVDVTVMPTTNVAQSGAWTVVADAGTDLNTSALLTTAAHDAAFGTAGTADTQVRTVQGIAGMTPVLVDGSGSTQPISGSVTATQATGTNLHTVVDSGTITTVSTVTSVTAIANALPAGTNAIGKLAANSGVDIGDVDVTSISAGTNLIGDVDISPRTTGGWSVGNFTSGDTYTALTNTAQVIKASAGKFGGYYIYNPNTSAAYVMIYDIAAASVTVGTSTPKLVFCIPAGGGANLEIMAGIPFGTALSCAAATTGAGNTAPTTALEAMIWYK